MTKYLIGFLCLIVVIISIVVLFAPGSALWFFASDSPAYTFGRLLIAALLLTYGLIPAIRFVSFRLILTMAGASLIYLGLAGLFPSDSMGIHNYFPLPIDVFLFLESGIACLLCVLELPVAEKNSLSYLIFRYLNGGLQVDQTSKRETKKLKPAH